MSDSRSGEEAWRILFATVRDEETILAIRASRDPNCQWLIGWLDEVYYPWKAGDRRWPLMPPANHATQFFPRIDKALAAVQRDMETTEAEFARLWPPAWPVDLPDEPMLPGATDWPVEHAPPDPTLRGPRRRRWRPSRAARFRCVDCGKNTSGGEYYMVRNELWAASGMDPHGGMLCLADLERRIGRWLTPGDFTAVFPRDWQRHVAARKADRAE